MKCDEGAGGGVCCGRRDSEERGRKYKRHDDIPYDFWCLLALLIYEDEISHRLTLYS